jgi:predicted membrane protein
MRMLKYTTVCLFAAVLCSAAYTDAMQHEAGKEKIPLRKVKLKFEVKRPDGTPVKGAIITLTTSRSDVKVAKNPQIRTTTEDGCAYFKRLKPAEYYYMLDAIDISPFHKEGTIAISENMNEFTETIIIVPDTAKL